MLPIQSNQLTQLHSFTRRELLKGLSIAALVGLASCTPVKYILDPKPKRYRDSKTLDRTLRAFVTAVIPGAPLDEPNLVRIYTDDYYPFAEYAAFFANDLDSKATNNYNCEFASLTIAERTTIIKQGLQGDATTSRLYHGAIYMAKVSFFAGIYDAQKGCPMIEFNGASSFTEGEMYYENPQQYFAYEITTDGNYH